MAADLDLYLWVPETVSLSPSWAYPRIDMRRPAEGEEIAAGTGQDLDDPREGQWKAPQGPELPERHADGYYYRFLWLVFLYGARAVACPGAR